MYISLVMGGLVAAILDYWLGRATVKDPIRLVISVVVGVLIVVFTYNGNLAVL